MRPLALLCLTALSLLGQGLDLRSLDHLGPKAKETVNITLDSSMLQLGANMLSDKEADQAQLKKLAGGLQAITVRSFEFHKPGEYTPADIRSVRDQLRSPDWAKIVDVHNNEAGEISEIYLHRDRDAIKGIAIITAEPTQFTVVQIIGNPKQALNQDAINKLMDTFGGGKPKQGNALKPRKEEE